MPSLNRDILNPTCEKLILDGNQNAIFNFAFSGKESFEAIKWKFSTISHLELYDDYYKIGWDKPSTTFYLNGPEIYTEKLMKFICRKVRSLHLDTCNSVYFPILDSILQSRKLETISIGEKCHVDDAYELISLCSESVKHLKILSFLKMKKFDKPLNLDSLTMTDITRPNFFYFSSLVKIPSLIINSEPLKNKSSWQKLYEMIGTLNFKSSFISSVTNLTFDERTIKNVVFYESEMSLRFGRIFKAFSSLKNLNFLVPDTYESEYICKNCGCNIIECDFDVFKKIAKSIDAIKNVQNFPEQINYLVFNWDIEKFKRDFRNFEFDDTKKEYICFRQTIETWMPKNTVFEIRLIK